MIIIVNSKVSGTNIQGALGKPEYSYYFLLRQFLPALEQIAQVISVESINEVDPLYREFSQSGVKVLFLSVSPPQQTPVHLECPTLGHCRHPEALLVASVRPCPAFTRP